LTEDTEGKLRIRTLVVGPLSCVCAIVACAETGEAAVVDPGGDEDEILAEVARMGVTIKLVLHTHGHFDHILGPAAVAAATGAPVLLHRDDRELYERLPAQCRAFGFWAPPPPAVSRQLAGGERLILGRLTLDVVHTPGHTRGGVCYFFAEPTPLLLAGDTLLCESVGRTDLPGGSATDLVRSIRDKLFSLPGATRVIPGHGPETTIEHERQWNPFVRPLPAE
jgi:glyoxylase-like metal-dependent hydrolase (beta-lactamase superfamily II)